MDPDSVTLEIEGISGNSFWDENGFVTVPVGDLEGGREYTVIVQGNDIRGNPMEPFTWSFTTAEIEEPEPDDGGNGIPLGALIGAFAAGAVIMLIMAAVIFMVTRNRYADEKMYLEE
jgi:hypothetical protein